MTAKMDASTSMQPQCQRKKRRSSKIKMLSPTITSMLALASMYQNIPCHLVPIASAFSVPPVTNRATTTANQIASKRTICNARNARLKKIASGFDLDEILSNEKNFATADDEAAIAFKSKKGNKRNKNKDKKKKMMKENFRVQNLEKERSKLNQRRQSSADADGNETWKGDAGDDSDEEAAAAAAAIDHAELIRNVDFLTFEVPSSLDGKRVDAVLVDLLNKDNADSASSLTISRSQCATLLSNECVFIVSPKEAKEFAEKKSTGGDSAAVPHSLVEEYSSPIELKRHPLEASSILIYPSRASLLDKSSPSALLSNFLPPTEIIAQNLPLDILFEDEHMIVINKRAGMVV